MFDAQAPGSLEERACDHDVAVAGELGCVPPVGTGDEELLRQIAQQTYTRASRQHDGVAGDEQALGRSEGAEFDAGERDDDAVARAECVVVEPFAEVAGRERGVEIHLDTGRRAEFDGAGETLLPAAPQRGSGPAESGRHEDLDGPPEVRAGDQQVGIEERPMFRAVVVEVGVREPLEHECLDAGLGEHRDGGDGRGLGVQGTPQPAEVGLARRAVAGRRRNGCGRPRGRPTAARRVVRVPPIRPDRPAGRVRDRPSGRGSAVEAGEPERHHGPLVGSEGGHRGRCGSVGHVDRVVRSGVVVIRA